MGRYTGKATKMPHWKARLFFALGLLIVLFSWRWTDETIALIENGVPASGMIVDYKSFRTNRGLRFAPIVEVDSSEHGIIRFVPKIRSKRRTFKIGEKVDVLVDPKDRKNVAINSFWQKWYPPIFGTFLGSLLALLALNDLDALYWLKSKYRNRKKQIMAKRRKSARRIPRWVSGVFFVSGIAMIAGAWWVTRDTIDLLRVGARASGMVVEMVAKSSSDGGQTYAPRVEVTSPDHGVFQFTSSMSSNPPSFAVGDKVEVIVDPQDRTRVTINSFGQLWFMPIMLSVMGIIFATVSLVVLKVFKSADRKRGGGTGT